MVQNSFLFIKGVSLKRFFRLVSYTTPDLEPAKMGKKFTLKNSVRKKAGVDEA